MQSGTAPSENPQHASKAAAVLAAALLFSVMLSLLAVPAAAYDTPQTKNAGFFAFEGYHDLSESGEPSGYGYDFLEKTTSYANLNYNYTGYDKTWEDMQQMLLSGEIDLVTSARKTPEREEIYAFSQPIGKNSVKLNTKIDNTRFTPGNYASYNGMKLGLLSGSSRNADVAAFAADKGFTYVPVYFETSQELASALRAGAVDAVATSSLRKTTDEKTLSEFAADDFYVIVRKDDTALLDEINYAISQMDTFEGNWRDTLYYRHYNPVITGKLHFSARENAVIARYEKTPLKILTSSEKPPYSYVDGGELKGIFPDIFAELARITGISYEFIPVDHETYARLIVEHPGYLRLETVPGYFADTRIFTEPYTTLSGAAVLPKNSDGRLRTVAVIESNDCSERLAERLIATEKIVCSTREEAVNKVLSGEADIVYMYAEEAEQVINADSTNRIALTMVPEYSRRISIAVPEDMEHELISVLNRAIATLSDSEKEAIANRYVSFAAADVTAVDFFAANPQYVILIASIIAVLVCCAGIFITRASYNRKLLQSEVETEKEKISLIEQDAANKSIIAGLAKDFDCVNYVTLTDSADTDYAAPYRTSETLLRIVPGWDTERSFAKRTYMLRDYFVYEDDREYFDREARRDVILPRLAGTNGAVFVQFRAKIDDTVRYYQAKYIADRDESGKITGIIVGVRDVDEQVRRELEQEKRLEDALAAAESASRAKTAFLFNMSHDIRTPMNAITGFTEMAEKHLDNPEKARDELEKVKIASAHLLELINEVLDMSRIESGKFRLEESIVDIAEEYRNNILIFRDMAEKRGLTLEERCCVRHNFVYADCLHVNRVILNVVSNAVKYTNEGGRVLFAFEEIEGVREGYARMRCTVEDTGIGMTPEFLEHVFDEFSREETSTVSKIQGTGLGMAIVRRLVDAMGGEIHIESEAGKGTKVVLVQDYRIAEGPASASAEASSASLSFEGRRVLLVEDNEMNREIAEDILGDHGLVVESAEDGSVAVKMLKERGAAYYDFVLMDIQMPVMNGYEATRAIRAMPGFADLPVLAMTANAFEEDRRNALEAGMNEHIAKPVDVEKLFSVLERFLK